MNCLKSTWSFITVFSVLISIAQPTSNPPTIAGDTTTINYQENDAPLRIDQTILLTADGTNLRGATITISSGYNLNEDTIFFEGTTQLTSSWEQATGELSVSGNRSVATYQDFLRGLYYQNSSENPSAQARQITITVRDNKNTSDPFTKSLLVSPVNDPPHIYESDETVVADTIVVQATEDVVLNYCPNAFDYEGDPYFLKLDTLQESSGSLSLDGSGECINYSPIQNFFGSDQFYLSVCDQNDSSFCSTALIQLQVNSVNDRPVISQFAADTLDFTEGSSALTIDSDLLISDDADSAVQATVRFGGDYFIDEDTLIFPGSSFLSMSWNDVLGILKFSGTGTLEDYTTALRQVQYFNTSNTPSTETRRLSFQVSDGADTSSSVHKFVRLIVTNDAPYFYDSDASVTADTLSFNTQEDTALEVCLNTVDPEGDSILFSYESLKNGSGLLEDSSTPFCILYTPGSNYFGTDYVNASVCDATDTTLCSTVVIEIVTTAVNDQPTLTTSVTSVDFEENAPALLLSNDLLFGDDNEIITEAWVMISGSYNSNQDTLILASAAPLAQSWNDVTGTLHVQGDTLPDAYSDILRQISYLNSSDNPDTTKREIKYWTSDGVLLSDTLTIDVVIVPQNDAPYFSSDITGQEADTLFYNGPEDQPIEFCPLIFDFENDDYVLSFQNLNVNSGTLSLNETKDCITYTPFNNRNGIDQFVATVCDVSDSLLCNDVVISLDVEAVNDAPVITNTPDNETLMVGIDINSSVEICLEITDVDEDSVWIDQLNSDLLLGTLSDIADSCFTYTPLTDSIGKEVIEAIVCDAGIPQACDTLLIEIRFPAENSAPQFLFDEQVISDTTYGILAGDSLIQQISLFDRERDALALDTAYLTQGSGSLEATVTNKLDFTYIPETMDSTTQASMVFVVCDDRNPSLCTSLNVDVIINYPPVILDNNENEVSEFYFPISENGSLDSCLILFDKNAQRVLVDSILGADEGTFTASVDNQNTRLCFDYITKPEFTGLDTIRVQLCDNGNPIGCSELTYIFEVFPTNHPPGLDGISPGTTTYPTTIQENDSTEFCFTVLDQDGDSVFVDSLSTLSGPGQVVVDLDSSDLCFFYKPPTNEFGLYEAFIRVCDDNTFSLCRELIIQIDVLPVNEAPLPVADEITITNTDSFIIDLLVNDLDPEEEGMVLDMNFALESTLGVATYNSNSEILYEPDPDEYKGDDIFFYQVCDLGVPEECVQSRVIVTFNLPIPSLEVYEAFSPNGDGINDTWFIDGIREFPDSEVIIRDQWNNIVYRKKGYNNKDVVWEGKSSIDGSKLREGTYYYIIELGKGGKPLTGFVVLKR